MSYQYRCWVEGFADAKHGALRRHIVELVGGSLRQFAQSVIALGRTYPASVMNVPEGRNFIFAKIERCDGPSIYGAVDRGVKDWRIGQRLRIRLDEGYNKKTDRLDPCATVVV
ncbi:hypothetical protein HL666_14390 [Bradyrhizobium sp. 83002]|uniref:hypothetical protein n=1 Tax=Bradyrhizobium aeschynomenes TaxID=2734909 RepID=UPI0015582E48|nr:hypothetical protein [Bradyrhizobium aeschynomenes]NPU11958.1 hypothetical protein [Bradyrhizobium aeschynomenes]